MNNKQGEANMTSSTMKKSQADLATFLPGELPLPKSAQLQCYTST